jgi:hypothetical protein
MHVDTAEFLSGTSWLNIEIGQTSVPRVFKSMVKLSCTKLFQKCQGESRLLRSVWLFVWADVWQYVIVRVSQTSSNASI